MTEKVWIAENTPTDLTSIWIRLNGRKPKQDAKAVSEICDTYEGAATGVPWKADIEGMRGLFMLCVVSEDHLEILENELISRPTAPPLERVL